MLHNLISAHGAMQLCVDINEGQDRKQKVAETHGII